MGRSRLGFWCFVACLVMVLLAPETVFAESLDVMDYGAVGDGVTDDRASIQAAIDDAAEGAGGGVVTFPAGTYRVEEIITLKSDVTLLLDDDATILNGIDFSTGPSIVFMTGQFVRGGAKVEWADTRNITIKGGTIDMNGKLDEAGTAPAELPNIGSSGAFALGYCDNVLIQGVTFLDSYKGHAIQICACDGVTIKDCTFKGQSLPSTLTESQKANLELIQIEPSTTNGFPYAANGTGEASVDVTIQGCYFGASEDCGEPSVGIGTHNQVSTCDKCADIQILENTFDNVMYAGVRFCGYEDVTIQGNTFIKKTEAESVNYRSGGCFLINAYCYNNTTEELDLNRRITIHGNEFRVADPKTRAIRVARDQATYLGTVTDITITDNTIIDTSTGSDQMGIQALRISDGLTITGNTITGGYRGIEVQYCTGDITVAENRISGNSYQSLRFIACGDQQTIWFYTHGEGSFQIGTANGSYAIKAVPNVGSVFSGYYLQNALTDLVATDSTQVIPISQAANVYRHALFQGCSHQFTLYTTGEAATCLKDGTKVAVCDRGCGMEDVVSVAGSATGHPFGAWKETVAAGCASEGVQTRTCSGCGTVETRSIPAVGHSYGVTVRGATCCDYASYDFLCGACGDGYTLTAQQMTQQWVEVLPDQGDFQSKTQYRGSSMEESVCYEAVEGAIGSQWVEWAERYVCYVPSWPAGFDPSSAMYGAYDRSPEKLTAYEDETSKVTVGSDGLVGYLYYHWCYEDSYTSVAASSGDYQTFHVYFTTVSPQSYVCDTSDDSYKTMDPCCGNAQWFFVAEVYGQESVSYRKASTCEDWSAYGQWGDTEIVSGDGVAVQTRTVYRLREAAYGEHGYADGVCTVCGVADPDAVAQPTLTLKYPSLSFESEILYNVYFIAENTDDVVEMGLATFDSEVADGTVEDATDVIPGFITDGSMWKVGTNGISAKDLGDTVWFKVYAKLTDGSYVYSVMKSYSAVSYANTILGRASSTDYMKALVVAMLNYGTEAQLYFGHNIDSLMNAGLTADQQALVSAYDESMMDAVVSVDAAKAGSFVYDGSSFARRAPTVSFDGAFAINYYFTAANAPDDGMTLYYWNIADYTAASVLTVDNATGSMEMVATDVANQYWGQVSGIAAKELDYTVFVVGVYESDGVTYTTGVLNYSIGKYCEGIAAKDTSDQQAFAQATAVYGYCAKEYFANL